MEDLCRVNSWLIGIASGAGGEVWRWGRLYRGEVVFVYNTPCEENDYSANSLEVVAEQGADEMIMRYYCTERVGRACEQSRDAAVRPDP